MIGLDIGELAFRLLDLQVRLLGLAVPVVAILAAAAALAAIVEVVRGVALEVTRSR